MSYVKAALVFLLACCGFLGGCASGPKFPAMALPPLQAGEGRMIIYRDAFPMALHIQPEIKVNKAVIGHAQPNSFTFIDRPAGSYDVTCMTEWEHKLTVKLGAGETRYVHIYPFIGVVLEHIVPEEVDATRALRELKDCSYYGPPVPALTRP